MLQNVVSELVNAAIQQSEEKIAYYKTLVETLKEIVDSLKWRHQTIGNMIRWRAFEAGN